MHTGTDTPVPRLAAARPGPTLRDTLRAATAEAHRALEATPLMQAITEGVPGPAAYTAYLVGQWQLHAPLEQRLAPWLPPAWAADRLVKTAWLESDLQALRQPLPAAPAVVAPFHGTAQALGALYVLEGATLGLNLVRRRLPPDHPARGAAGRFMAAYGEQTGPRWAAFLRTLEGVERCDWPMACQSAADTFAAFQNVFERLVPCPFAPSE